jgi:predicted molibdopterin-dependent oxidoreductase YjgC
VELCSRFRIGASYGSAADILGEIEQAAPQYAGMKQRILDEPWGGTVVADPDIWKFMLHASRATAPTSDQSPFVLARDGVFDWGRDPLVSFSPTLSRDYRSQRKLFPNGFLQLCKEDADELGVRAGGRVTLTSAHGHAVVPIQVRADLKRGVLLVPYAFRDHIADVLGTGNAAAVKVERI